jgi:hypothetical protein
MAQQTINRGSAVNDPTAESLYAAFGKVNDNFDELYPLVPVSKTLTYNMDGTLDVVTDANGTKTMGYSGGLLVSVTGTGAYPNKTFHYTGGLLDSITVS